MTSLVKVRVRGVPTYVFAARAANLGAFGAQQFQMGTGAGSGAAAGAASGASIGSAVPVIGTAIGAVVGAVIGAIAGSIGKKDPEDADFQQAIAIYNSQGLQGVLNISNKYLVLAGLFDLRSIHTNIPIYKKYGRMGEQRFVTDLCNLLYSAGQAGKIAPTDTVIAVKQRIVDPWIDSFGYGPMADPNAKMIDTIILGMTAEYLMGGQGLWLDVKGNPTFKNLPNFALPAAATATPPVSVPIYAPQPTGAVTPVLTSSTPVSAAQPVPQVSSVAIPGGFNLVGTANGMPAYQGADGRFYSWNGTQMLPLTGTLTTSSGNAVPIQNGVTAPAAPGQSIGPQYAQLDPGTLQAIQSMLAQGATPQQTYQAAVSSGVPPAAAANAVQAAGTGAGLPSWMGWAGVGLGVIMLGFALARPSGGKSRARFA